MNKANMIKVSSASDWTVVIDVPEINLRRTWSKRGAETMIDRDDLITAFYNAGVETLFKDGSLYTEDKEFLSSVGLLKEDDTPIVPHLDEALMKRMISVMPASEVKTRAAELSHAQLGDLAEYAIAHYTEMRMDRIELLTKLCGRNLNRAIENYRADKAD